MFAGQGRLTRALRRRGFQGIAIDHIPSKHVAILRLNLTNDVHIRIFDELLNQQRILYVHFAPPCGTASLARAIKLGKRRGPPPLRSLSRPMGLRRLTPKQQLRVNLANKLYTITCHFMLKLHHKGVGWSIENPSSSLMWVTKPFYDLMCRLKQAFVGVSFHTCMYNAPSKKTTALWTSVPQLQALAATCDESHQRLPWGLTDDNTFATAEECAYNDNLCSHWAQCIVQYALDCNLRPPPSDFQELSADHVHQCDVGNRAILGVQPRGNRLPPLLTDFLIHQWVTAAECPQLKQVDIGARLPNDLPFPPGSCLLALSNDYGGEVSTAYGSGGESLAYKVGVPVSPEQYVAKACKLVHPELQNVRLSSHTTRALEVMAKNDGVELRRHRLEWCQELLELTRELGGPEKAWLAGLPAHMQRVLRGKRFLTLEAALKRVGYQDSSIAKEATAGFPLVGWMNESGVFASNVRPPKMHPEELEQMAASFNARTLSSTRDSGDCELDHEVWLATCKEVEAGFLVGPISPKDLLRGHVVSPRFGLRQGTKVRPIDNLTASGVNLCVGLPERLQVETVDEICAMIKGAMQFLGSSCELVGRSYHLKKAYRQLAVSDKDSRYAWISVWDPTSGEPKLFNMKALPFGGTASVASFLRFSRALKELGVRALSLLWLSFYDDFVIVCRPGDEDHTDRIVRHFFKSFGWVLSEDDEKNVGFSRVFTALGVEFDLASVAQGVLRVGNTQKRRNELEAAVDAILQTDELGPKVSESLKSRLMFAESQIYGRCAKTALRAVGQPALDGKTMKPLNHEVRFALEWMKRRIVRGVPREIRVETAETLYLFIDGACEPDKDGGSLPRTSIGGVLLDGSGRGLYFFGAVLPKDVVSAWSGGRRTQLIFEAEILPYLIALKVWQQRLRGVYLVVFIDNDGAKHSWIRGFADSKFGRRVLHHGALLECDLDVRPYFSRVPTSSNLGDSPSRLGFEPCLQIGAVETVLSFDVMRECALADPLRNG